MHTNVLVGSRSEYKSIVSRLRLRELFKNNFEVEVPLKCNEAESKENMLKL